MWRLFCNEAKTMAQRTRQCRHQTLTLHAVPVLCVMLQQQKSPARFEFGARFGPPTH